MQCLKTVCDELEKIPVNDPQFFPQLQIDLNGTQPQSIRVSVESAGEAIELIDYFLPQAKVLCCGRQDKVNKSKKKTNSPTTLTQIRNELLDGVMVFLSLCMSAKILIVCPYITL